jgi:hypothetical protein
MLIRSVSIHGEKRWSEIAQSIPGRKGKQCRERYLNHLDPGLVGCDDRVSVPLTPTQNSSTPRGPPTRTSFSLSGMPKSGISGRKSPSTFPVARRTP